MNKYHQEISQKVSEFSGLSLLKLAFLEKQSLCSFKSKRLLQVWR